MPTLDQHHSNEFVKLLAIGNSKSGKTGSLVSLLKAGYRLFILDMDNLLDVLKFLILKECPDLIKNVEYVTLRDERIWTPDGPKVTQPKAYAAAVKMMQHWKYGDVDHGKPAEWGPDCIFVLDSLSRLCDSAFDFRESLVRPGASGKYDLRAVYKDAQDSVENNIANLTSEGFRTNLIVIAHVTYQEMPDGTVKGFPQGVGQKLSPKIPQYFSTVVLYDTKPGGKRTIITNSTPLIDLANPKPFEMGKEYPIETGLADIFKVLKGAPKHGTDVRPETSKSVVQPIPRQLGGQSQGTVRRINRPV